jgi:hypothetical protein
MGLASARSPDRKLPLTDQTVSRQYSTTHRILISVMVNYDHTFFGFSGSKLLRHWFPVTSQSSTLEDKQKRLPFNGFFCIFRPSLLGQVGACRGLGSDTLIHGSTHAHAHVTGIASCTWPPNQRTTVLVLVPNTTDCILLILVTIPAARCPPAGACVLLRCGARLRP